MFSQAELPLSVRAREGRRWIQGFIAFFKLCGLVFIIRRHYRQHNRICLNGRISSLILRSHDNNTFYCSSALIVTAALCT